VADPIIETHGLRKSYPGVDALAGLNLTVPRGAVCGLLGRNGAGKTTTIKVLLGMVRPTAGTASVFGLAADSEHASVEIRRRATFVSEDRDLYDTMSVGALVRFTRGFYPHWNRDLEKEYLARFELPETRGVKELSRGMRTKLALLLALANGAELLILDEPTAGLDPVSNEELLQLLVSHVARTGLTVLLSTHQLTEVEQIADHVAIIDRGRTILSGALDDIRARYRRVQVVFDGEAPAHAFAAPGVVATRRAGRVLTVLVGDGGERAVEEARTLGPKTVDVLPVTLKEIFLENVAAEVSRAGV
jgi:ABC-2 type transport system ATP-binding protein